MNLKFKVEWVEDPVTEHISNKPIWCPCNRSHLTSYLLQETSRRTVGELFALPDSQSVSQSVITYWHGIILKMAKWIETELRPRQTHTHRERYDRIRQGYKYTHYYNISHFSNTEVLSTTLRYSNKIKDASTQEEDTRGVTGQNTKVEGGKANCDEVNSEIWKIGSLLPFCCVPLFPYIRVAGVLCASSAEGPYVD